MVTMSLVTGMPLLLQYNQTKLFEVHFLQFTVNFFLINCEARNNIEN